jgi:hypothetical protein
VNYDLTEYRILKVWAEMFHDAQVARIRLANRIERAPVFPDIFAAELAEAEAAEHRIRLGLRRQYRRAAPPGVKQWQADSTGIGIDLLARLLGHLGHPRIATPSHWEGSGDERKLVPDPPFERTVGELWQYCGHGRPGRATKGMTADELFALGNPTLKMLAHLLAESAIKEPGRTTPRQARHRPDPSRPASVSSQPREQPLSETPPGPSAHPQPKQSPDQDPSRPASGRTEPKTPPLGSTSSHQPSVDPEPMGKPADGNLSATQPIAGPEPTVAAAAWPYRQVYEERRAITAERVHAGPCVRCGPSGHPAQPGSPWAAGHQHADALRIVGKAILKDLWLAAAD